MDSLTKPNFDMFGKIVIFLFLYNLSLLCFAQDILLQKNGQENMVKILEINPKEVVYKYSNYLDGPILVIPIDQVFMVTFQNGKKEMTDTLFGRKSQFVHHSFSFPSQTIPLVELKSRGIFVQGLKLIGGYDKMYQLILETNNPDAKNQFLLGEKQRKLATQYLASGILFESVAVVSGVSALVYLLINSAFQIGLNNSSPDYGTSQVLGIAAGAGCVIGTGLLIGSAIKRNESKQHYRNALDIYNSNNPMRR